MSGAGRPGRRERVRHRAVAGLAVVTLAAAVSVPAAPGAVATPRYASQPTTDLIRARQWHLSALHVNKAWKWGRGGGVTVAVLDTGVDARHPDLVGQVITGPDYTGGGRKPGTKYWGGHGTGMASIIAGHGSGPDKQSGVLGIAPKAKILSIRVTWENDDPIRRNDGQVTRNRDAVANGIRYAVDHGADIINMSLGGGRMSYNGNPTEEAAIEYALSKGVVLIASAGNDGAKQNRRNFPAAYPGVIAVGALNRDMKLWRDSNRRSYVEVCAPGVDIISAAPGNRYVEGTGTSPSSAIVAGLAALIRGRYAKLTPDEIRQALIQAAPKRAAAGAGGQVCSGPVDAVRAIAAARKINQTSHGAGAVGTPRPDPAGAQQIAAEGGDSGPLLVGILGGGAVLVVAGLLLGWRQRRRSEPEDEEYGLEPQDFPGAFAQNEPLGAPPAGMNAAPVALPAWQGAESAPPGPGPQTSGAAWPSETASAPPSQAGGEPWLPEPMSAPPQSMWPPPPPEPAPAPEPEMPVMRTFDPLSLDSGEHTNGNGHANGNGHSKLDPAGLHPFDVPSPSGSGRPAEPDGLTPPSGTAALAAGPEAASGTEGLDRPGLPGGPDPGAADPYTSDGDAADPLSGPSGSDSFGADPYGGDPLTGDPFGAGGMPLADTPLADESWRSVHGRSGDDKPAAPDPDEPSPTADEIPTSAFPAVDPVPDEPWRDEPERPPSQPQPNPNDEDDYRPPWL